MGSGLREGPLVSVAIPAHNAEATIAEAVQSILEQTYRPVEVVVVDDGSTDGTWRVLQGFGSAIRAIRQDNQGIAAARNAGLRAASGDLIALMDADDISEPERIAAQVACLRALPDVVLCASEFSAFDTSGRVSVRHAAEYYGRLAAGHGGVAARFPHQGRLTLEGVAPAEASARVFWGTIYDELALGNFLHPPTVMFRRSVLDDAGWFDPAIRIMCEWDWLVRVARLGPIGYIDHPLLQYRLSAGQVSFSEDAPLDSIRVAKRILARDPELRVHHRREARELLGGLYADAASAGVEAHHRWAALRLLAQGALRYRLLDLRALRILGKIVLPGALVELLRDLLEVTVTAL